MIRIVNEYPKYTVVVSRRAKEPIILLPGEHLTVTAETLRGTSVVIANRGTPSE